MGNIGACLVPTRLGTIELIGNEDSGGWSSSACAGICPGCRRRRRRRHQFVFLLDVGSINVHGSIFIYFSAAAAARPI